MSPDISRAPNLAPHVALTLTSIRYCSQTRTEFPEGKFKDEAYEAREEEAQHISSCVVARWATSPPGTHRLPLPAVRLLVHAGLGADQSDRQKHRV